jgi:hypothetical protein
LPASPNRTAPSPTLPPNMKIDVTSGICWRGLIDDSSSSTVEGCGTKSWSFPGDHRVFGSFSLENKCSYDYYTGYSCESGTLNITIYHTNGSICNQASTSARYGSASTSCRE